MKVKMAMSIHQKTSSNSFWDTNQKPIIIAHRGGNATGADKENTLAAFNSAHDLGYIYGETDVIRTADGQVVAIHGSSNWLDSILEGKPSRKSLQKMTLEQIHQK